MYTSHAQAIECSLPLDAARVENFDIDYKALQLVICHCKSDLVFIYSRCRHVQIHAHGASNGSQHSMVGVCATCTKKF